MAPRFALPRMRKSHQCSVATRRMPFSRGSSACIPKLNPCNGIIYAFLRGRKALGVRLPVQFVLRFTLPAPEVQYAAIAGVLYKERIQDELP
jgi:hypothetical protein